MISCTYVPKACNCKLTWQHFLQVFVTQQYLAIAMEYAAGGDMFEHVVRKGGLKESEARWFFQQLLVGVDYVHRMVRQLSGTSKYASLHSNSSEETQQASASNTHGLCMHCRVLQTGISN